MHSLSRERAVVHVHSLNCAKNRDAYALLVQGTLHAVGRTRSPVNWLDWRLDGLQKALGLTVSHALGAAAVITVRQTSPTPP